MQALQKLWQYTQEVVNAGKYSLVLLDELSVAISLGLIAENEVLNFLRDRPGNIDIILTGSDISPAILDLADQVTDVRRSR